MAESSAETDRPGLPALLHIGLDSWIIQDGNYDDFHCGGEYAFALEFYPHEIAPAQNQASQLRHRGGSTYEVRGNILHSSESAWVVDFGVPAFNEGPPPSWARRGHSIAGLFSLRVDPFFYKETLRHERGMPNLFRRWRVIHIFLETTPWVQTDARTWTRDSSKASFTEVALTNAWVDDEGHGSYVLACEVLPGT